MSAALFGAVLIATIATGCASSAKLPVSAGTGPNPTLPAPTTSLIPDINVAKATGWSAGATPVAAPGTTVRAFAVGLQHPRWLYVLPNGDVLVAETNAPARPREGTGIRGWFFKHFQKKAGGAAPGAHRISLLRDADGDGVAELKTTFLQNLNSPFGMALIGHTFYIANSDAIVSVPYVTGETVITATPAKVADLPAGLRNHHWTKNIIASPDGTELYVAVGSNSNVAENGMAEEVDRACLLVVNVQTGARKLFASGLRNPVGMAWQPETKALWVAVNERDELGGDLVPDYMTSVREGGFYGWPYSYFGASVDKRVKPPRPDLVATAMVPDYALGPHTASLGLVWSGINALPVPFRNGMFVGQHGSWNRTPRSGYRVIFVPFVDGRPSGQPIDVLTGFLNDDGKAMGRPVGVAIDAHGALLVADDVGNVVWRVQGR